MKYIIKITFIESGITEVVTLTTDDLKWSMSEYQRNRKPFKWEIIKEE